MWSVYTTDSLMAEAANLEEVVGGGSDANSLTLTAASSFSSTLSSSDLDTESTTSFFPGRSITLGSLIGITGGASAMAEDDDPSSRPRSSGVSHVSRIRRGAKLWSLLPCGTCIGFCYANKGTCKGLCCASETNGCIVSSATVPMSLSLGHFLISERDTERSLGRDVERLSNDAKVYINIMYEESAGTSYRLEEPAVNPLYDLDSTPAIMWTGGSTPSRDYRETRCPPQLSMWSQSTSAEAGVMPSLHVDDETYMMQASTAGETTPMCPHAAVAPGHTPSLPVKGQKLPSKNVSMLGCVSYMWARCRV